MALTFSLQFSSHYAMPWSRFHCPKEFIFLFTSCFYLPMKILHTREKKEVGKKFKDTFLTSLMGVRKKWKISFLNVSNISFKEDEIALMWPRISNCSDWHSPVCFVLLVHKGGPISGTYFFPHKVFKLEALSDCIRVSRASRNANCAFSISILLRTKGGAQKHYTPVQIPLVSPQRVATAIWLLSSFKRVSKPWLR